MEQYSVATVDQYKLNPGEELSPIPSNESPDTSKLRTNSRTKEFDPTQDNYIRQPLTSEFSFSPKGIDRALEAGDN